MPEKKKWKYCVVGNITKSHIDEDGTVRYGTPAFTGGTKVYLCGKYWNSSQKTITVIGITRGSRKFHVIDTNPAYIENVRCARAYHPAVLELMNDWEMYTLWWDDSAEDKQETMLFAYNWNTDFANTKTPVLRQFYGKTITDIKAYGIDEFDFTPAIGSVDFSVGQFGYTILTFEQESICISVDGLSTTIPLRKAINELQISKEIRNYYIGAILESIEYDGKNYWIKFQDYEVIRGYYSPNKGYTDRSYFELDLPWV